MKRLPVFELKAGSYYNEPVFLEDNFILLTLETPLSQELIDSLNEWEYSAVQSEGIVSGAPFGGGEKKEGKDSSPDAAEAPAQKTGEAAPTPPNKDQKESAAAGYKGFYVFTEQVLTDYVNKSELNVQQISYKVKELVEALQENRRTFLKLIEAEKSENMIVTHAVKSTIIALLLGTYFRFPAHKMIELGTAAVLHEIGMVRLPPQVYQSSRPLSDQERKAITAHPVIGFNILREAQFPLSVCLAALEHHERMDGSGYPRALSGDKISAYAKIITAACSYEALTSARPYKEAKDGHAGIVDLLKNVGKQYDEAVIKGLVVTFSLYPVGLHVLLSDGRKAQVVDVNPDNPRYPVVAVLGDGSSSTEAALGADGAPAEGSAYAEISTSQAGIFITRPLAKKEIF
jgi:HD-GYP domain-containing protein (c-di-GMP phosphodiesterase class II)